MKNIVVVLLVVISFVSCNKKETSSYTIIPEDTIHQNYPETFEPKKDTLQFCYLSVVGKDSLHLSYTLYPTDSVKGKMSYDNFEKDGSTGKVYGIKSGDTLKLTYDMFSEGMHSLIDVRFLTKDNKLYEGITALKQKNDSTMIIVNDKSIDFEYGRVLSPVKFSNFSCYSTLF